MSENETVGTSQYLTFTLGEEVYALDVGKVREILEVTKITKVPHTPEFMRGVFNLRGSVVPVIDMRLLFAMGLSEQTVDSCIIVVEVDLEGEALVLGALADAVQEVVELEPERIEPAPTIGTGLHKDFIRGMCTVDGRFVMILDMDTVFSLGTLTSLSQEVA